MGISNQLLAIEAGHHTVLKRLFVAEKLGEHRAQLKVILA